MGWADRRAAGALAGLVLAAAAIAGCCNGGAGSNHRCDFTSPLESSDAGSDGPVTCGTEVCTDGKVCCLTKSPPNAGCVEPGMFESLHCEKMDLPCFMPSQCPARMACCLKLNPDFTGDVSCQPLLACLGGAMSYVACSTNDDCPSPKPMCVLYTPTDQGDFKICE